MMACPLLETILSTSDVCDQKNLSKIYKDLAPYRNEFLTDMIRHQAIGSIFAGEITINTMFRIIEEKKVYDGAYVSQISPHVISSNTTSPWNIVGVHIVLYNVPSLEEFKLVGGHATFALINNDEKTIEYFEPNGTKADWLNTVGPVLESYFKNNYTYYLYTFIPPRQFCPYQGPQQITQDELCANWSSLYIVLRLACPDVPRRDLVTMLTNQGKEYLQTLIYKWICYMTQYIEDTGIRFATDLLNKSRHREDFEAVDQLYEQGLYPQVIQRLIIQ